MDTKQILALYNELLEKYKNARLIVIMDDAKQSHKLLADLDREIDELRGRFEKVIGEK